MVQYIMRAYLMSAIHRFIDPHQIPAGSFEEGQEEEAGGVPNMKLLYKSLGQALTKYAVGSKVPTEEEIRTRLEQRAEEEKQVFINKLDKMGREEKRVELVLKGLGMGAWAAGGSKAIRKYDAERYEVERAERAAAGIMDYPGAQGDQGGQGQEGRAVDMFGFNFGGEYDAAGEAGEGGYDHEQMAEDDY
jgi:ribosomal protein L18E